MQQPAGNSDFEERAIVLPSRLGGILIVLSSLSIVIMFIGLSIATKVRLDGKTSFDSGLSIILGIICFMITAEQLYRRAESLCTDVVIDNDRVRFVNPIRTRCARIREVEVFASHWVMFGRMFPCGPSNFFVVRTPGSLITLHNTKQANGSNSMGILQDLSQSERIV